MRARAKSSEIFQVTRAAAKDFSQDQCGLRAAALSYYTVFALPPLLILLIKLAGLIWSPDAVQTSLETQFGGLVGSGGASEVRQMVAGGQPVPPRMVAAIVALGGLLAGGSRALFVLQVGLNAGLEVKPG